MKYYKHKLTGRIIDEVYYEERLSNHIKHMFEYLENADDNKVKPGKTSKVKELTPEEYENFI